MRILSLFDGIACGYEALQRAGIKIDKYYSSEIDPYAIQIAQKNHPDIIQLGDVNEWERRPLEPEDIDMLIGGSPCQGFSMAGKMLNFDDPRSALFFKYLEILKHYKPKYFLLENVKMKKEFRDKISELIGVEPILIDSAKVSAQHRERYYRTNIPGVEQPEEKNIYLKDIIEEDVEDKYYLTDSQIKTIQRNFGSKGKILNDTESLVEKTTFPARIRQIEGLEIKTPTLPAAMGTGGGNVPCIIQERKIQRIGGAYGQTTRRGVYSTNGIAPTLTASAGMGGGHVPMIETIRTIRKLTPIECERLQTLPDDYTAGVSNTQRYKALGNGWTVDVISHIFSYITKE